MTVINHKVKQDGDKIVERLRTTDITLEALMAEYRCGYDTIMREIRQRLTKRQWERIARKRLGKGGKATRFQKGLIPWNKGKKGYCPTGCEATQFKKGSIRGSAARRYRPIGSVTIRYDRPKGAYNKRIPCRWIKVGENRYKPLAQYIWEKAHGPVPKGMFVVHADNDRMNDSLENLICVNHREHMRRLYQRPAVIAKCRKRAAKATRERHAEARKLKAAGGKVVVSYGCLACGETYRKEPELCPKCGGMGFERIERTEYMPDSERQAVLVRVAESELKAG